jgi:addiction module RelE/StbE family toxin
MNVTFHNKFQKIFKKLPPKLQLKFDARLKIFLINPNSPLLNNHSLSGEFKKLRSINVTGDYRAIFEIKEKEIIFRNIGTHSQLYG